MKPEEARGLVGSRILADAGYLHDRAEELVVVEVSLSGAWVKVRYMNGAEAWKLTSAITLIERLGERPAPMP